MFSSKHINDVFLDYTLDQLINSNIYLGYVKKLGHESMFRYLIGTRLKSDIINLNYTLLNLRISCNFIYQVLYNYGYLWLVDCLNNVDNILLRTEFKFLQDTASRVYIFVQKGYPGTISNFLEIFKSVKVNGQDVLFPNVFFFFLERIMYKL